MAQTNKQKPQIIRFFPPCHRVVGSIKPLAKKAQIKLLKQLKQKLKLIKILPKTN